MKITPCYFYVPFLAKIADFYWPLTKSQRSCWSSWRTDTRWTIKMFPLVKSTWLKKKKKKEQIIRLVNLNYPRDNSKRKKIVIQHIEVHRGGCHLKFTCHLRKEWMRIGASWLSWPGIRPLSRIWLCRHSTDHEPVGCFVVGFFFFFTHC